MLEKWTILVFGLGLVAKGEDKPRIWDRRKFGDVTVWRRDSASYSGPDSLGKNLQWTQWKANS